MIGGIIGDIVGSVYEGHQWTSKGLPLIQNLPFDDTIVTPIIKNISFVRKSYGFTDDTLCTLGLYYSYINSLDYTKGLQDFCIKHQNDDIGYGKSFKSWLDNPTPYNSYANGSIMRIGFIPFLDISLNDKLQLGFDCTKISHNHPDSFKAVNDYILMCDNLKKYNNKNHIIDYLNNADFTLSVEDMHLKKYFELNALQTLFQALRIVYESNSFEDILINTCYVGGDTDTLACIACNIGSIIYPIPQHLMTIAEVNLINNQELYNLVATFSNTYWEKF